MLAPVLLGLTVAATPVADDAIIIPTTTLQEQVETRADDWALTLELPDLGQVQCRLLRHRVTSSSTRFVLGSRQGPDRVLPFNPETVLILSGSIEGVPGSHVSLVATGEHLRGRITLSGWTCPPPSSTRGCSRRTSRPAAAGCPALWTSRRSTGTDRESRTRRRHVCSSPVQPATGRRNRLGVSPVVRLCG